MDLGQPKAYYNHNGVIRGCVGDSAIGLPYTSDPIILDQYQEWLEHQLFKTKVQMLIIRSDRHCISL